jgi:arabinogalactan oligomer/maltooligosaccharide transport system permease protein
MSNNNTAAMDQQKRHMGLKASARLSNTIIYIILVIMSIIWLIPFVFITIQSFRETPTNLTDYIFSPRQDAAITETASGENQDAEAQPSTPAGRERAKPTWGFGNYVKLWNSNFRSWYINTFIIALATAFLQTVIILCMSYTLSRFRFKLRKGLMRFMLILGMFPGMLTMIILYRVLADLGLTKDNAVPGLILVYIASSGMGYYVSKGFFDTIPKSLDEAARVDGANRAQVLWKIILPLAKPIVIYTILTAFMAPWGDFVFARYISFGSQTGMNVAVGMYNWLGKDQIGAWYTAFCAGGVAVALPVTILFMCLQKYYVEGVTGGAVKG